VVRWSFALALVVVVACAGSTDTDPISPTKDAGTDAAIEAGPDSSISLDGSDASGSCSCEKGLHNQSIVVLSDASELYAYDPVKNEFEKITDLACAGQSQPYSMAVDARGKAWILFASSQDLRTIDVNAPSGCENPGYTPGQAGFGLFGMAFSTTSETSSCEQIYALGYSGTGPFGEGPGIGKLGKLDSSTLELTKIADTDYDGGELAGTGNGRLFAFAGVDPAKLVEYDKTSGTPIETTPLTGLSKTTASAFAFFAGDIYFFTEQEPPGCDPCLAQNCSAALAQCQADLACAEALKCALEQYDITDECGGLIPAELQSCVAGTCLAECFPDELDRKSWVHRLDANGQLTLVNPEAPIRIVGAGSSTCVQYQPR
jgi:hypothetical protein